MEVYEAVRTVLAMRGYQKKCSAGRYLADSRGGMVDRKMTAPRR
jgi:hypothetical protein